MTRRLVVAAAAAPLLLALPASSQGFVERAAAIGLDHVFTSGLDRIGNLAIMNDWGQVGMGIADLNGDGRLDVVAAGHLSPTQVFRNDGGTFTNISATAGLEDTEFDNSVALADYDGDGDIDVWLGTVGPLEGPIRGGSRLFENDGNAVFTNVTARAGTVGAGHSIAGKWFDLDYDGDLDLLVSEFHGTPNQYYVNNGDGTFSERGVELGLAKGGSTHVMSVVDVDADGYVDVLVGNDWRANVLTSIADNEDDNHLKNDGTGSFIDVSQGARFGHGGPDGSGPGSATMGMTWADVDYDGDLDVFKTEQDSQTLVLNGGWPNGAPWAQVQQTYGVANASVPSATDPGVFGPAVGWGCFFFDVDRDRYEDLFKVNGHVGPNSLYQQQNYLFLCDGPGAGFVFSDQTAAFGLVDLYDDRGLACGDLDADGDIDLLIAPPGGKLRYFENQVATSGGYLHITVDTRTSAPGGLGTELLWTDSDGYPHLKQLGADAATASTHENMVYFGTGPETELTLTATFPSGMTKTYASVAPNQRLTLVEPEMIRLNRSQFLHPSAKSVGSGGLGSLGGGGPMVGSGAGGAGTGGTAGVQSRGPSVGYPGPTTPRDGGAEPLQDLAVTVFAHDASGTPLDESASVTIVVPGLPPKGPVKHLTGNVFRREFEIDGARPGSYRVEVAFDSFQVRIRPTVNVVGAASDAQSTCVLTPDAVRAGSADTYEVCFVPKDVNGLALGTGLDVEVEIEGSGGLAPTPMVDVGDGSYLLELPAPAVFGLKDVSVHVDGVELPQLETLDVSLSPFALNTLFYREDPHPDIALHRHQFRFQVTPRDLFGMRIGPNVSVQLVVTPDPGTEPVYERTDISPVVRTDGKISFVVERDPASAIGTAQGTVEVIVEGAPVFTTTYSF